MYTMESHNDAKKSCYSQFLLCVCNCCKLHQFTDMHSHNFSFSASTETKLTLGPATCNVVFVSVIELSFNMISP